MLSHGTPIELAAAIDGAPHAFGGVVQRCTDEMIGLRIGARRRDWPFPAGTEVHIDAVDRCDIVSFTSTVTGVFSLDTSVIVEVVAPESYTTSRRDFFRLAWRLPVTLRWDDPGTPDDEGRCATIHLETEDIGGGGLGVVTKDPLNVGDGVEVTVGLAERAGVHARARVARVNQIALSDPPRYRVGLVFEELPKPAREQLIRFIFEKQREIRRNELG
jgi:c-di-GMP-binding flagellar brake protein YcgR